eukprot:19901-Heterococcus_DN1.PRE.13
MQPATATVLSLVTIPRGCKGFRAYEYAASLERGRLHCTAQRYKAVHCVNVNNCCASYTKLRCPSVRSHYRSSLADHATATQGECSAINAVCCVKLKMSSAVFPYLPNASLHGTLQQNVTSLTVVSVHPTFCNEYTTHYHMPSLGRCSLGAVRKHPYQQRLHQAGHTNFCVGDINTIAVVIEIGVSVFALRALSGSASTVKSVPATTSNTLTCVDLCCPTASIVLLLLRTATTAHYLLVHALQAHTLAESRLLLTAARQNALYTKDSALYQRAACGLDSAVQSAQHS